MESAYFFPTYEEFLDFVVEKATPEEVLAFKVSPEAQAYAHELIERNRAGTITPEERQHLEQMVDFERMMGLLKAKALKAGERQSL
jgi:hypothetical protein